MISIPPGVLHLHLHCTYRPDCTTMSQKSSLSFKEIKLLLAWCAKTLAIVLHTCNRFMVEAALWKVSMVRFDGGRLLSLRCPTSVALPPVPYLCRSPSGALPMSLSLRCPTSVALPPVPYLCCSPSGALPMSLSLRCPTSVTLPPVPYLCCSPSGANIS